MQLIKIKITPRSSFVTFPKGDTLFGHFAYHSFMNEEKIFENYITDEPKIIFSDILPADYLYKPTLPLSAFGVKESAKKEFRKKAWIKTKNLQDGALHLARVCSFFKTEIKVRNSINRVSFSTDDSGVFAPHSIEEITFLSQPVIYILHDKEYFDTVTILERLNRIGKVEFGKKGSIGKGHFRAEIDKSFQGFKPIESKYYLTLSPTILNKQPYITEAFYNTFNRFGKYHSTQIPFKKPLLMADSGAVMRLEEPRPYIGRGIDNGLGDKKSFVQGYSIVVPFKFEGIKNGS